MSEGSNYRAFLLRLWREGDAEPWRLMLEDADTGERTTFADPAGLCRFLSAAMGAAPHSSSPGDDDEAPYR